MRFAIVAALVAVGIAIGAALALGGGPRNAYDVQRLVSDRPGHASHADAQLVNAWGLAASPTGPWWTANEASSTSTLYSGAGRKQLLTVRVAGGPTGVAWYAGKQLLVSGGGVSDPARFIYACEDGKLRAWTPTVPGGWSTQSEVVVDEGADAAVFRGVAIDGARVYATDFHNARVDVYDGHWRRVRSPGAFVDPSDPRLVRAVRHPGDRRPCLRHVRLPRAGERQRRADRRLRRRVRPRRQAARARRARRRAERAVGARAGAALVRPLRRRPADRQLRRRSHQRLPPSRRRLVVRRHAERPRTASRSSSTASGGSAFGNGGTAGPAGTLFFTSGPHAWRGETELGVHGLLGSISPA